MSKAYPSNLTRDQYEFLSDLIPEAALLNHNMNYCPKHQKRLSTLQ